MVSIAGWCDMLLHDDAVDLYRMGYRSKDKAYLVYRGYSDRDADRICDFLKDMEVRA